MSSTRYFKGVWRGYMVSFTDNRRVKIEFDVKHLPDNELAGYYHCAPINGYCINNIDYGTVHGRISDPSFNIKTMDQNYCNFFGDFERDAAEGRYACYGAGNIHETGYWKLRYMPDLKPNCGWGCRSASELNKSGEAKASEQSPSATK